ncbi:TetR/AcrR family transcriptional regulator [Novosphingobium sp.]|uniref:TetR/AcrR family transcriptional regulator n=1 Tax=Novosphingobium sp. TaxID=1874826 RepID=UPI003BAAEE1D
MKETAANRIIQAFAERARLVGVRKVVMADLAKGLGISTATVYRAFATKTELVSAMLNHWTDGFLAAVEQAKDTANTAPSDALSALVIAFVDVRERFNDTFWNQVRTDYPILYEAFETHLTQGTDYARGIIAPLLRADVDGVLAEFMLTSSITSILDDRRLTELKRSRRDAVLGIVDLWTSAFLQGPRSNESISKEH